jgi:alpha-ketoglutarate-dependent taurine dioxygenase
VRFNCRDMLGFAKLRNTLLTAQAVEDLKTFDHIAQQCVHTVDLQKGDCIIVDNHRALHGRSAFDAKSGRLLKRLRIK